jgi:hypothetical protein
MLLLAKTRSRQNLLALVLFVIALAFLIVRFASIQEAAQLSKRSFDNTIPKHVPLEIKIKRIKEDKVRDLENKEWFRDFELEVTNKSEKPIYYLSMNLMMPELIGQTGGELTFTLRYGNVRFQQSQTAKPLSDDIPIAPKATYTFVIKEQEQQDYQAWLERNQKTDPTKLELILNHLSFGDGTGFTTTGGLPFPIQTGF